ncbi:MAG: hypothetical protein U9R07_01975 [Pseudomonadota bacterium]|nr:hypothetical protein [Pseudomonadota bacterium]
MNPYQIVRDWVDRQWHAKGGRFKILLLPAILPLFLLSPARATQAWVVWAWFVAWNAFVAWRYWVYLKAEAAKADIEYDRKGKFRLSAEYHDTESATASAKRTKKD